MDWARILAYVTGTVDQELLARNEYLAAENRILKAQLNGRPTLSDAEQGVLGEIGHRLGRKVLADVATVAQPHAILGWSRKLVAGTFDGSMARQYPGSRRIEREVEELIIRMASENQDSGYDRIAGALATLGHEVSDQTVGKLLRRHGLSPAPERKRTTPWAAFVRTHLALRAGSDFFTAVALPPHSPNLNAYAERWVRSVKEECLSKVILFGERSLRRALSEYVDHFHAERNHQGKGNVLLFPRSTSRRRDGPVRCRGRLGGLLRYYHREAA